MTKKQNKRSNVRRMRRVLSRSWEAIRGLRMGIHRTGYGGGLARGDIAKIEVRSTQE